MVLLRLGKLARRTAHPALIQVKRPVDRLVFLTDHSIYLESRPHDMWSAGRQRSTLRVICRMRRPGRGRHRNNQGRLAFRPMLC